MCGIAAVLNGTEREAIDMGRLIRSRGTSSHVFTIGKLSVCFHHLPITDPSSYMKQPFVAGKWHVWLNGYISNWKELADRYEIEMETKCDTELLAKFIDKFGFSLLGQLNGFFSVLATVDGNTVTTFTDRYGIKQLYHKRKGQKEFWCSEIKGFIGVDGLWVSPVGIEYWKYSLGVIGPDTIYNGVQRVPGIPFRKPKKINITYKQAVKKMDTLLDKAMQRNAVEGYKTGVFLSGGVDSGTIAKRLSPDYCFSVDYLDKELSEIENIKANSRSKHYTIICNEDLKNEYLPRVREVLDDFKAGSSYTNLALTEMASKFCTVLYSGAGGDEVFNGYVHRYNRPISEVIRRTKEMPLVEMEMTHKEYDWLFLRAVLVVEDRMAGAFAMETRYPFLDNDLVDFALSLPDKYLEGKKILKEISGLDTQVVNGKKRGFSNPYLTNDEWTKYMIG